MIASLSRFLPRFLPPASRSQPAEYDAGLLWSSILLLAIGLVMVYSASIAMAEASRFTAGRSHFFLVRHAAFLGIAVVGAMLVFQVPVRLWQQAAPWLFALGVALLVAVLVPFIGRDVNGARRWLALGPVNLQPSELMKLFAVLYAADYTVRKSALMHSFKRGLLPMLGVMLVVGWLLLREPDFGALVVIAMIAFSILFLGGMNGRHFSAPGKPASTRSATPASTRLARPAMEFCSWMASGRPTSAAIMPPGKDW